jgi:hypothetical protein
MESLIECRSFAAGIFPGICTETWMEGLGLLRRNVLCVVIGGVLDGVD